MTTVAKVQFVQRLGLVARATNKGPTTSVPSERYLHDSNPQPLNLALYPTELKKYMVVPQHKRKL
jgi:hypothetical protein